MVRVLFAFLVVVFAASASANDLQAGVLAHGKQDFTTAATLWTPLAEQGDAIAQNYLGALYAAGQGVPKDAGIAIRWFQKSADQGNVKAIVNLANIYYEGEGVEKNLTLAAKYYQQAAELGDVPAKGVIGMLYVTGEGVARNENLGVKWLAEAALAEDQNALMMLFLTHVQVESPGRLKVALEKVKADFGNPRIKPDNVKAFKWIRRAAELGDMTAQVLLGQMFSDGIGTAKNAAKGLYWYRKSAEQGSARGQYLVGYAYFKGIGVHKNEQEAIEWLRKAAEQGDEDGQNALGVAYAEGKGVEKNFAWSVYWSALAAQQGDPIAPDNLESVINNLDRFQTVRDSIPVRAQPSPDAETVMLADANVTLYRLNDQGDGWYEVYLRNKHTVGFVQAASLRALDSVPARKVVAAAPKQSVASSATRSTYMRCSTKCSNGDCLRIYEDGRKVRFQAKQVWNSMSNQFEWDSSGC